MINDSNETLLLRDNTQICLVKQINISSISEIESSNSTKKTFTTNYNRYSLSRGHSSCHQQVPLIKWHSNSCRVSKVTSSSDIIGKFWWFCHNHKNNNIILTLRDKLRTSFHSHFWVKRNWKTTCSSSNTCYQRGLIWPWVRAVISSRSSVCSHKHLGQVFCGQLIMKSSTLQTVMVHMLTVHQTDLYCSSPA